jgi:hypothetical protein
VCLLRGGALWCLTGGLPGVDPVRTGRLYGIWPVYGFRDPYGFGWYGLGDPYGHDVQDRSEVVKFKPPAAQAVT